jgi:hypothetical protein
VADCDVLLAAPPSVSSVYFMQDYYRLQAKGRPRSSSTALASEARASRCSTPPESEAATAVAARWSRSPLVESHRLFYPSPVGFLLRRGRGGGWLTTVT